MVIKIVFSREFKAKNRVTSAMIRVVLSRIAQPQTSG
jgi:hypothetical protein